MASPLEEAATTTPEDFEPSDSELEEIEETVDEILASDPLQALLREAMEKREVNTVRVRMEKKSRIGGAPVIPNLSDPKFWVDKGIHSVVTKSGQQCGLFRVHQHELLPSAVKFIPVIVALQGWFPTWLADGEFFKSVEAFR